MFILRVIFTLKATGVNFYKKQNSNNKIEEVLFTNNKDLKITLNDKSVYNFDVSLNKDTEDIGVSIDNKDLTLKLSKENNNTANFIINEFTVKGNKTHPDRIELLCTKEGETDGITVYYDNGYYTLDDGFIKEGEFIVITVKEKLKNTSGFIAIHSSPSLFSTVIDRIEYGSNTNDEIDVSHSSATRSISRTDSGKWIITKTKGQSFGEKNCEIEYQPSISAL